ncbi:MAG: glutaminyl-peptide cyclotransferase, partial [Chloroflexota bacterium]
LDTWEYETEGWGITHNGRCLIMSDGSATLYFRDPETFAEVGRIVVQDQNGPVPMLNELEYIQGEVWANIWQTDRIVRINPASGQVVGSIDFTGLLDPATLTQPANVLNGIAYDGENGRLFITGKLWPTLFEIELVPEAGSESG